MRVSVLATERAFSSQRARAAGCLAGFRAGSPRARTRIQRNSARASSQISEFRSCMHSVSWIHARAGGWEAAHAMEWARLPGRRKLPNMFEKPAARKLKYARSLRSLASALALARARGSEVTQFYWGGRRVHKSEIIRKVQYLCCPFRRPSVATSHTRSYHSRIATAEVFCRRWPQQCRRRSRSRCTNGGA